MEKGYELPVSGEKTEDLKVPIINAEGNKIGEVDIIEAADGVTIDIIAEGLTPGKQGIHIHEKGNVHLQFLKQQVVIQSNR